MHVSVECKQETRITDILSDTTMVNTINHQFEIVYGWLSGWMEQCFTSPPTQYRLYGRRFLHVKRPNQQYQSTEGTYNTQITEKHNNHTHTTQNTANPLVYDNMGW